MRSKTENAQRRWAIHHMLHEDGAPDVTVGDQIDFAVCLSATVRWLSTMPGCEYEPTLPSVAEVDGYQYEVISAIDSTDGVDMGPFRAYLPDALSHPALAGKPARFRGRLELVDWMEGSSPTESAPAEFIRTWRVERILANAARWRRDTGLIEVRDTEPPPGGDAGGFFVLICTPIAVSV